MYYNTLSLEEQQSYLDLWYSKPFYGKVDTNFDVRHLSSRYLKELNSKTLDMGDRVVQVRSAGGKKGIYALNFVADAFEAMAAYLRELNLKGQVSENVFFYPLIAHKGWQSTNEIYRTHVNSVYNYFTGRYLLSNRGKLNRKVASFEDYVPHFNNFLNLLTERRIPLTKGGFILNLDCPHSISGLVIEMAKENNASDDLNKYTNYFGKRRQMKSYIDIAEKFGFYIDMNMPWRLVANLESPAWEQNPILKEIVDKYFPTGYTVQKVFDKYYHKPHDSDVQSLKIYMMQFYNSFIEQRPTFQIPQVCQDINKVARTYRPAKKVRRKNIRRRRITMEHMDARYDDLFWIRTYMQLRAREMQLDITEHQLRHELREIEQIYNQNGTDSALTHAAERTSFYLEQQLNKFLSLKEKGKNLLINGHAPDIIF